MDGGLPPPAPLKGGDGGETDKCGGRCCRTLQPLVLHHVFIVSKRREKSY